MKKLTIFLSFFLMLTTFFLNACNDQAITEPVKSNQTNRTTLQENQQNLFTTESLQTLSKKGNLITQSSSTVITTISISGTRYYIMLDKLSSGNSEIWARKYNNMSSVGDIKIMSLQTLLKKTNEAMNLLCTVNNYYSTASTIAGCGSVVGTGICIYTGAGAGLAAPVCVATSYYAATTGLVDCVSGLASTISNYFNTSDFGILYQMQYGTFSPTSAVSTALSLACDSWKKGNQNISSPTALTALSITSSSFSANWNLSAGATSYSLDISTSSSFSICIAGYNNKSVGNVSSYFVSGLMANTLYYYRLHASNGTMISTNSNSISVQTLQNAPAPPIIKSATNVTTNSFIANWNLSYGATIYYIDVSISSSFSNCIAGYYNKSVGNGSSYSVSGLTANTFYYYRLRASNGSLISSNSSIISVQTLPMVPLAPSTKSASNISSNGFTANWNASTGANTYYLDISTTSSFSSFVSGYSNKNVGNTTFSNVSGLKNNTVYYYRIRSANSAGSSNNSATITVTTKK